jgi:hypothetical protein
MGQVTTRVISLIREQTFIPSRRCDLFLACRRGSGVSPELSYLQPISTLPESGNAWTIQRPRNPSSLG